MSDSQETPPSAPTSLLAQPGAEGGLTSTGLRRTLRRMSQRYPRAPSSAAWAAMSPEEQARVHAALPGEVTEEEWGLPEGDWHFHAKKGALEALRTAFAEVLRRKAYVAADLPVYYPNARRFAPDLLVVLIGDTLLLEFEELVAQLRQETQQWKARALEEERRRKAAEQERDEEARGRRQAEEENARLKEENARLKALLH